MGDCLKKTYKHVLNDVSGLMKLACVKINEYIGITLDFSTDGEVMVTMIRYVREILDLSLQHNNS